MVENEVVRHLGVDDDLHFLGDFFLVVRPFLFRNLRFVRIPAT